VSTDLSQDKREDDPPSRSVGSGYGGRVRLPSGGTEASRAPMAPVVGVSVDEGHLTADLMAGFVARRNSSALAADVVELARSPRGRHHPAGMARARGHVLRRLHAAGWTVRAVPFERRWFLGVTDRGGPACVVRRIRLFRRLRGVNLLADLPGAPREPRVLIVAHLDSVAAGPGADDNASGVAALLECARLVASLPEPPGVQLAVVDMEELGRVGSTALAADRSFLRGLSLVICLESVGTFTDEPGTQRLAGLGLVFRDLAARVRADDHRGNFLLGLCRRSSERAARTLAAAAEAGVPRLPVYLARDPRVDGWRGRLLTALLPPLANLDRSDHAPFWNRGVPAVLVTTTATFRNREYHRPGDRPDRIDFVRLTAVAAAVAATAVSASRPCGRAELRTAPGDGALPGSAGCSEGPR
jgi:Peptidase family M28